MKRDAKNKFKGKHIVFVDFFDTLMFRKVHPFQIYERWSYLLSQWLEGAVSASDLLIYRKKVIYEFSKNNLEYGWNKLYSSIYNLLNISLKNKIDKNTFIEICHRLEVDVEIGAQYPHAKLIDRLKLYKTTSKDVRIYIVSDFHLDNNDLAIFLRAKKIDLNLFDGIFVSSEYGCSKSDGNLYKVVLDFLDISSEYILMIGDNPISDGRMARVNGIMSRIEHNYLNKLLYQIRRFISYDYSKHAFHSIEKTCRRYNSPYTEYSILFHTFSKALWNILLDKGAKYVTFLSREGHYLQRSFEGVLMVLPPSSLTTNYFLCSRRASQSTSIEQINKLSKTNISIHDFLMSCGYNEQMIGEIAHKYNLTNDSLNNNLTILDNNKDYERIKSIHSFNQMIRDKIVSNKICFRKYIDSFKKDNIMNIVDIGWKGGMQESIESILGQKTEGYYLGVYNSVYSIDNKHGLLFTYCPEKGAITKYSEILRANTQLYEQLTAAPHGSAVGYITDSTGSVKVLTDWAKNEKGLYNDFIAEMQEEMLLIERGVTAWAGDMNGNEKIKQCAYLVLRSALFADEKRLSFLRHLDKGFIWNFNAQSSGLSYRRKDAKVALDILYSPEKYTRYFSKIQRVLPSSCQCIYIPIAALLYIYILIITKVKYAFGFN